MFLRHWPHLCTALLLCALPQILQAQATTELASTESFALTCTDASCDGITPSDAKQLAGEFENAWRWLGAQGFPLGSSELEKTSAGKYRLSIMPANDVCPPKGTGSQNDTLACVEPYPIDNIYRMKINRAALGAGRVDKSTIAHELVHVLQNSTTKPDATLWFDEAVAEAVGLSYGRATGTPIDWDNPVWPVENAAHFASTDTNPIQLNDPSKPVSGGGESAVSRGYSRSYYLLHLGRELGSKSDIAYLKSILRTSKDRFDGLERLYKAVPQAQSFSAAFPRYIAKLNMPETARKTGQHWYGALRLPQLTFPEPSSRHLEKINQIVAPYAAHPVHLPTVLEAPSTGKAEDGFGYIEVLLPENAPDGLKMAFEHKLLSPKETVRFLTHADGSEQDLGFVRLINAPRRFSQGAGPIDATFGVAYTGIGSGLGGCMEAGRAYAVFQDEIADEIGGYSLEVTNGTAEGRFVRPDGTGDLRVKVNLASPITRKKQSVQVVQNKPKVVELGPFPIDPVGCMIKLTFPDQQGHATYSFEGDYTEMVGDDGTKLYFREGDLAIYEPSSGWVDIPAPLRAMMAQELATSQASLLGLTELERAEEAAQIHMPLMFAKTFSKSSIKAAQKPLSKQKIKNGRTGETIKHDSAKKAPQLKANSAPCPDGGQGCTQARMALAGFHVAMVTFDAQGRAVVVDFGSDARFELAYGNFLMGRPGGW